MRVLILNPPDPPQRHAYIYPRRKIHATVLTPSRTVRLARDRSVLDNESTANPNPGGLTINDTTGTVELEWEGDLWIHGVLANAGTTFLELDV
jgi:hypothetical protein